MVKITISYIRDIHSTSNTNYKSGIKINADLREGEEATDMFDIKLIINLYRERGEEAIDVNLVYKT